MIDMQDPCRLVSYPGLSLPCLRMQCLLCGVDVAQSALLAKWLYQIYALLNNQFETWVNTHCKNICLTLNSLCQSYSLDGILELGIEESSPSVFFFFVTLSGLKYKVKPSQYCLNQQIFASLGCRLFIDKLEDYSNQPMHFLIKMSLVKALFF